MKHNILKLIVGIFSLGLSFSAQAQLEKNEVYLFTCPIAEAPVYQQIAVKLVTVLDQGAQFQYFVMDVEAGNDTDNRHGEGYYPKYIMSLFSSQNANTDSFVQTTRDNYMMLVKYVGDNGSRSSIHLDFSLLNSGAFVLGINGSGPLFNQFKIEFNQAMSESDLYTRFEMPECTSDLDLRNYLD